MVCYRHSHLAAINIWMLVHVGLEEKAVMKLSFAAAVTAVAFAGPDTIGEAALEPQPHAAYRLAVGLESGDVQIWSLAPPSAACDPDTPLVLSPTDEQSQRMLHARGDLSSNNMPAATSGTTQRTEPGPPSDEWHSSLLWQAPVQERHSGAVRRLAWRNVVSGYWQLASCSDDHAIRTYDIRTC